MTRRPRAEAFHELVEDGSSDRARVPEYAGLLQVVEGLRAVPAPVADPGFVASLRERLMAEAETVLVDAAAQRDRDDARLSLPPRSSPARRRQRRLAAAVSGVALVGVTTTVAVASQSALPGDRLYSVKRGLESAHAQLTFDRAARGRVLLDSAGTRLDEAQTLSRMHADPSRVNEALDAFTGEAIAGSDLLVSDYRSTGDASSITTLRTFAVSSMERLDTLQREVPPQSLDALLRAAQTADQVQQTSLQTCPSCTGPDLRSVPEVLLRSTRATLDAWQLAVRAPRSGIATGPDGGPVLPHIKGQLPPASVTNPDDSSAAVPPGDSPAPDQPSAPTAADVQHTVQHLTDGLTHDQQNDVASTVTDTAGNLLDAVGQVGNEVAQALDDTVGGVTSDLPSLP